MAWCGLLTVNALIGMRQDLVYLRRGISELAMEKEVLLESIRICKLRNLVVNEKIESWFTRCAVFIAQMDELLQCNLFYWKFWSIGRMAKRVAKARAVLTQLIEDGKFANIGFRYPMLPRIPETINSVDGTVGLTSVFETVWYLLIKEAETKVITIHGLPGVGKSTLLRKVCDALGKKSNNFETIIQVWDGISPCDIQDSILKQLNFPHRNISMEEKALMINTVLANKRCIVLLDSFQTNNNNNNYYYYLEDLGLKPLDASRFKSKIVVACRSKKNFRYPLDWHKSIEVQPLLANEAWDLLKTQLPPQMVSNDKTYDMARKAANTCGGLPLAVEAIRNGMTEKACADKGRDVFLLIGNHEVGVYSYILKWMKDSFFGWDTSNEKICFILCCLFPAASLIRKDQLMEYWKGWMLDNFAFTEDAIGDAYRILEEFESEGLLEERGEFVTMNPFLCRMAIWIASDYGNSTHNFFVQAGKRLTEVPKSVKWEEVETVSLMDNNIEVLDEEVPICHKLTTMILSKNKLYSINGRFFDYMPVLKVLDLSWSEIEELPMAICNLISLKSLNLSHTQLSRLPKSMGNLVNLQTLDLSHIAELCVFPTGVVSRLVGLQSLNLIYSGYEMPEGNGVDFYFEEEDNCRIGSLSFFKELEQSSLLDDLGLCITSEATLEELNNFDKTRACITSLSIVGCKGLKSLTLSSIDFEKLETLEVSKCINLKDFKMDKPIFNRLASVTIKDCRVLEELSWVSLVPNLKSLKVERCMNIKKLISDDVIRDTRDPFQAIRSIYLDFLPVLTIINEDALSFDNLEDMTVIFCPQLRKLPFHDTSALATLKTIKGHEKWWDQLTWVDTWTRLAFYPYFLKIDS